MVKQTKTSPHIADHFILENLPEIASKCWSGLSLISYKLQGFFDSSGITHMSMLSQYNALVYSSGSRLKESRQGLSSNILKTMPSVWVEKMYSFCECVCVCVSICILFEIKNFATGVRKWETTDPCCGMFVHCVTICYCDWFSSWMAIARQEKLGGTFNRETNSGDGSRHGEKLERHGPSWRHGTEER